MREHFGVIFISHGRRHRGQPTEHQLEMDFKRLIQGKADGEMVIANESPHTSGGVHTVVDDVHKGRTVVKESAQGEIKHE